METCCNILAVINVNQITNWEKTKIVSKWVIVTFDELKNTQKADHFAFSFKSQNLQDLLNFQFTLLNSNNKKIGFIDTRKKISTLNFKIEVLT